MIPNALTSLTVKLFYLFYKNGSKRTRTCKESKKKNCTVKGIVHPTQSLIDIFKLF